MNDGMGLTKKLSIGSICPHAMNDWKTEFPLGQIFRETFVVRILGRQCH
jgi:hypothetical protein